MRAAQTQTTPRRAMYNRVVCLPCQRAVPYLSYTLVGAWRSPASASALGAEGPGFKSRRPDHTLQHSSNPLSADGAPAPSCSIHSSEITGRMRAEGLSAPK